MAALTLHVVCGSPERIGSLVADRLAAAVSGWKGTDGCYLGMATGSTPQTTGFWRELQRRAARGEVDLSACTCVNPDEWIGLSPQHVSEAYHAYLTRELSDHFPVRVLVPDGNAADPIGAALAVEQEIVAAGGFAWMMLGMGINGHVGFYEPCVDGIPGK